MKTECKIGVYVCNCGTNIAKMVDCEAVSGFAADQPGVVACIVQVHVLQPGAGDDRQGYQGP